MTTTSRLMMADYDYDLPQDLIAQEPLPERDASRLMVLDRGRRSIEHRVFRELPRLLSSGDVLVVNDSRVLPARMAARKPTGGQVELLLLRRTDDGLWEALAKPLRRLRVGTELSISPKVNRGDVPGSAQIAEIWSDGRVLVRLDPAVEGDLSRYGEAPIPPYITQALTDDERYQTVFASVPGSAAAPTAGLHFSDQLLASLRQQDIEIVSVTLHVGLATFRPVTVQFAEEHHIHSEWCSVGMDAARAIVRARGEGRRVVAVGTTAARTLETFGRRIEHGDDGSFSMMTDLYILPGYRWRLVDAMITNFHLPRSTLLMMVSAFATSELVREAYAEAIRSRYRFYSFGDAMLIT
jgi:S-adenosylmethionine:tRNA ribosyltransferase-isomerase